MFNLLISAYRRRYRKFGYFKRFVHGKCLEIGAKNGDTAIKILNIPKTEYYGIDVFEGGNDIIWKEENSSPPSLSYDDVCNKLSTFGKRVNVFKGKSIDVIPTFSKSLKFDFVYFDGGHSFETVKMEWDIISKRHSHKDTVFVFDDYGVKPREGITMVVDSIPKAVYGVRRVSPVLFDADDINHMSGSLKKILHIMFGSKDVRQRCVMLVSKGDAK